MEDNKIVSDLRVVIKCVLYKTDVWKSYECDSRIVSGFVYYIRGGHTIRFKNGQTLEAKPGSFVYLPQGCGYTSIRSEEATEFYQIDFFLYDNDQLVIPYPDPTVFDIPESSRIPRLCKRIYDSCLLPPEIYRLTVLHDLMDLIVLFMENVSYTQISYSREYTDIAKTVAYIQENYVLDTPVRELAALSSMSISAMEQRFRTCLGRSPIEYRNGLRIENACRLLRGGFSIPDTAARVGFSDRYYFTRCFRKYTGVTPGTYLRRHKNEEPV